MNLDNVVKELSSRLGDIVANYEEVIAKLKIRAQEEVDRLTQENEDFASDLAASNQKNSELLARLASLENDVQEEPTDSP
jgi:anti-sigma-K factor RskA